jgi:hypothetical protein
MTILKTRAVLAETAKGVITSVAFGIKAYIVSLDFGFF